MVCSSVRVEDDEVGIRSHGDASFFGNMPKIFAAFVEVTSTTCSRRFSRVDSFGEEHFHSILDAGMGHSESWRNHPCPSVSAAGERQWSVATTWMLPWSRPPQSAFWSFFSRSGGLMTHLAPSKFCS